MRLKDKVAVVTGAGSGIGRSIAREFASEGAVTVLADIDPAGAQETARQIESFGGTAFAVTTDVSIPESVAQLRDQTLNKFSRVHVLVNNAAVQVNKTVEDTEFAEWNREIAVNIGGVFLCSKFFLPIYA